MVICDTVLFSASVIAIVALGGFVVGFMYAVNCQDREGGDDDDV